MSMRLQFPARLASAAFNLCDKALGSANAGFDAIIMRMIFYHFWRPIRLSNTSRLFIYSLKTIPGTSGVGATNHGKISLLSSSPHDGVESAQAHQRNIQYKCSQLRSKYQTPVKADSFPNVVAIALCSLFPCSPLAIHPWPISKTLLLFEETLDSALVSASRLRVILLPSLLREL